MTAQRLRDIIARRIGHTAERVLKDPDQAMQIAADETDILVHELAAEAAAEALTEAT